MQQTLVNPQTNHRAAKLRLRPFEPTPDDYAALVALNNAVWPDRLQTVMEREHGDKNRNPVYFFDRWLAEIDGQVVASGELFARWWSYAPGKYAIELNVHPDYRERGIGGAFWDHLFAMALKRGANDINAHTREDQVQSIRFLEKRGLKQVLREPRSILDVPAFDPAPFQVKVETARAAGLAVVPLKQLMETDPDWKAKMYDLDCALMADVPMSEEFTPPPVEQFAKMFVNPNFIPEAWLIGVDNGHYVGMSCLWGDQARDDKLWNGLTGTRREYRRKGLATAMKVAAIQFAKGYGAKEIETENEENNPMYQLNLQLGYRPAPAYVEFHLALK